MCANRTPLQVPMVIKACRTIPTNLSVFSVRAIIFTTPYGATASTSSTT